jgi:hypothetical protein
VSFYGRTQDLIFDPARLMWSDHTLFLDYSTKKGPALLKARHTPPDLSGTKWQLVLPPKFYLNWTEAWDSSRAMKEANLI